MALTAIGIEKAICPSGQNQCKKFDTDRTKGLYLLIKKSGAKTWYLRFTFGGKKEYLRLGAYPTISLKIARNRANEGWDKVSQGINPLNEIRAAKPKFEPSDNDFGVIALKWWGNHSLSWSQEHTKKVKRWILIDMKLISKLSVDKIDQGHVTEIMLAIETSGHASEAPPILSVMNRIFGYALAHRLVCTNPAQGFPLSDILKPRPKVKHRAAITDPIALSKLILAIDSLDSGSYCTIHALRLIPRLFLRPKEIRILKWEYVDFEGKILRIPIDDMKKDREHLVPLAKQVIEHLKEIIMMTGYSKYVFPNERNADKPMSKNVMTNRLRKMGYGPNEMTSHGFRTTASTLLHEQGWKHDAIETQLSHLIGSETSRAYNRSIYLQDRTNLMQAWADYLDLLRKEAFKLQS